MSLSGNFAKRVMPSKIKIDSNLVVGGFSFNLPEIIYSALMPRDGNEFEWEFCKLSNGAVQFNG